MMEIEKDSSFKLEEDISSAVATLKNGGVILYPTDTIWGLGCDATNDAAVERLFKIKNRPSSKAMISLVESIETLKQWIEYLPSKAECEIHETREPLTIIFDSPCGISTKLKAEDGSAAYRIPLNDFTREICRRLGRPLVSTSANESGQPSPLSFSEISPSLLTKVDYICNTGREKKGGCPSRILKICNDNTLTVIR